MRLKHFLSVFLTLLTLSVGQMWGATITFKVKSSGASGSTYITTETEQTTDASNGSLKYKMKNWNPSSGQVRGNQSTIANNFYIYNTDAIPGTISGISITGGSYTYSKIYYNTNTSSITSHTTTNSMSNASATISNGTGTFFRMNFTNGATSGQQNMTSVTITFCPNPTSLTNGTITANTAHLSWSDTYNTNSYEVYVSTSSTTPAYNATPSATGGSGKSADVTGLNAGTTYNWWVRSKSSDTSKSQWVKGTNFTTESAVSCSNSVALSEGTATNGTINTISEDDLATCSETASDRRVTVTITPAECFNAPDALTYTGDGTATMQGDKTDNGDGTFSYVYQFAQNDNGSGTFGVTCTAKAAGKTVNFDAGAGTYTGGSLTETCDGSGITLPSATASGICKGWTTFAGWATSAVSDSTTTSVTLYAAGSKFTPSSDGQTLYAVYSKNKGGESVTHKLTANTSWNSYTTGSQEDDQGATWAYKAAGVNESGTYYFGLNSNAGNYNIGSPSFGGNVTSIKAWVKNGSSNATRTVYICSSNSTAQPSSGDLGSKSIPASNNEEVEISTSGTFSQFYIYVSAALSFKYIEVTVGGSTTYYCSDPNCCTELAQIKGSFNLSHLFGGFWPCFYWAYGQIQDVFNACNS